MAFDIGMSLLMRNGSSYLQPSFVQSSRNRQEDRHIKLCAWARFSHLLIVAERAAIDLGRRLLFQMEQRDERALPPKSKYSNRNSRRSWALSASFTCELAPPPPLEFELFSANPGTKGQCR